MRVRHGARSPAAKNEERCYGGAGDEQASGPNEDRARQSCGAETSEERQDRTGAAGDAGRAAEAEERERAAALPLHDAALLVSATGARAESTVMQAHAALQALSVAGPASCAAAWWS